MSISFGTNNIIDVFIASLTLRIMDARYNFLACWNSNQDSFFQSYVTRE